MPTQHPAWDSQHYEEAFRFVSRYGEDLLALLDPQLGQRILDIGCGTGHLTQQIHERGAEVIGLDSSPDMIASARQQYQDVVFVASDARDLKWVQAFDAVFSNAALHWIPEAETVVQQIHGVLRPGGRLVAELGGAGNVQAITSTIRAVLPDIAAIPDWTHPWYFPTPATYASLLEANDFRVRLLMLFDRPTYLEGEHGLRHWVRMFLPDLLAQLDADQQAALFAAIENRLRAVMFHDGGWVADYVRLRVVAERL